MALNLGGGASGAVSGAAAGSSFGPWGTAIGAGIGGVAGLFGGGKKKKKRGLFDSQQKKLYTDYINGIQGQGPMAGQYNYDANQANSVFDQNVANPAIRQFKEDIVPNITGQYRKNNLMQSSYSGEALSRAGRDVGEKLAALRAATQFQGQENASQRKQDAIQNALGMSSFAYETGAKSSPIDQILGQAAPSGGEWFKDFLGSNGKQFQNYMSGAGQGTGSLAGARGFGG